jgi:steroid delta-isomerase-like uncharacterized protein
MSIEQNKQNSHRVIDEIWNQGNLAVVDELYAPDFVNHTPTPGSTPDREGIKKDVRDTRAAFPDSKLVIDDLIADENTVVTRWTFTGTHTGELWGIPATGKHVTLSGIHIDRIANGQATDEWYQSDTLGMLQQLGVIPAPETS